MTQKAAVPPARGLYDLVEELRTRRGWTKVQLSRIAGVHRSTIENWKIQPKPPQASTVVEIADALYIDRDQALRLAGITGPTRRPPETAREPEDELLTRVERIRADPTRRALLDQYLDLLDSTG